MIAALLLAAATFSVHVTRDVPYAKNLALDVYEPAGAPAPRPAFIAIHGGGFTRGSKRSINAVDLCEHLAARGFACFAIDYRLGSEELASADAERAVQWVVAHSRRYAVDATRIAIGGDSAGAVAALNVAYHRKTPRVRAVLSWSGGLAGDERIVERGGPPLMIVHGTEDKLVPIAEARALAVRAVEVGVLCESIVIEGEGHVPPLDYDRLSAFLARAMKLP